MLVKQLFELYFSLCFFSFYLNILMRHICICFLYIFFCYFITLHTDFSEHNANAIYVFFMSKSLTFLILIMQFCELWEFTCTYIYIVYRV